MSETKVLVAASHGDYAEMTPEDRTALPAAHHRPMFDGLGTPNSWLCAVCWGEGWVSSWPCDALRAAGRDGASALAESLGLEAFT